MKAPLLRFTLLKYVYIWVKLGDRVALLSNKSEAYTTTHIDPAIRVSKGKTQQDIDVRTVVNSWATYEEQVYTGLAAAADPAFQTISTNAGIIFAIS